MSAQNWLELTSAVTHDAIMVNMALVLSMAKDGDNTLLVTDVSNAGDWGLAVEETPQEIIARLQNSTL